MINFSLAGNNDMTLGHDCVFGKLIDWHFTLRHNFEWASHQTESILQTTNKKVV